METKTSLSQEPNCRPTIRLDDNSRSIPNLSVLRSQLAGMDSVRAKEEFFRLVLNLESNTGESPFQKIYEIKYAPKTFEEVVQGARVQVGDTTESPILLQDRELADICTIAENLYGEVNAGWMEYELRKNELEARKLSLRPPTIETPSEDNRILVYQDENSGVEVVHNIEKDNRLFTSDTLETSGSLPQVVLSQFFPLAQKGRWYEVLPLKHLSQKGSYIIGYSKASSDTHHPRVSFSCRTQGIVQKDPNDSLFSLPCFTGSEWQPKIGRNEIRDAINSIFLHFNEESIDVDLDKIPENSDNIIDLQQGIISAFGANNLSDVFRFGMGKYGLKNAYNAVGDLAKAQVKLNNFASFTIIEEPLVRVAQAMEKQLQKKYEDERLKCIHVLSQRKMKKDDLVDTCHVLFYNVPTSKVPKK